MNDPTRAAGEAHAVPLSPEVRDALQFQSYAARTPIHDVVVRPLRKHRSENGWFAELLRLEAGGLAGAGSAAPGLALRQISISHAEAGRINAFHIHPKRAQSELWTVLSGQLLVWLFDCRQGSPTEGARQQVVLSGEEPAQLHIPAGIAHGYRAGPEGATLIYAMDQQFEVADPDEGRLPWDFWGADLWDEDRG